MEKEYGYLYSDFNVDYFFTNKKIDARDIEKMKEILNNYNFKGNDLQFTNQIHSTNIKFIGDKFNLDDNDAIITNKIGVPIMIFTADCVPVIFYDNINKVVALAHAGWRGTFDNIVGKVVNSLSEKYGCKKENIKVVIGPHISFEKYEVSKELVDRFAILNVEKYYGYKNNSYFLNLFEINKQLLLRSGIIEDNIKDKNFCTVLNNDKFYSYREDNKTLKRIGTVIQLRS